MQTSSIWHFTTNGVKWETTHILTKSNAIALALYTIVELLYHNIHIHTTILNRFTQSSGKEELLFKYQLLKIVRSSCNRFYIFILYIYIIHREITFSILRTCIKIRSSFHTLLPFYSFSYIFFFFVHSIKALSNCQHEEASNSISTFSTNNHSINIF